MKLNLTTGLVPNLNVSAALLDTERNTPGSTKEPGIGWMTGFLFVSSFVGLLVLVPLRKAEARLGLEDERKWGERIISIKVVLQVIPSGDSEC
ncbi:hypothetical protein NC653_024344 [Populus alba x Populus x berolinensis]|uniref:Uncharacterized protein n=1 Tax=Populus alba x Populus x berolinensis TaxID=444605 RepID=A0AAD6M8K6_9ROSI|nr:hypothetical protein NC653_024344 [Populus alba x Populus x berolinensis]